MSEKITLNGNEKAIIREVWYLEERLIKRPGADGAFGYYKIVGATPSAMEVKFRTVQPATIDAMFKKGAVEVARDGNGVRFPITDAGLRAAGIGGANLTDGGSPGDGA